MPHLASCLAVLGTGSDVGKSLVTAALCRVLSNRGVDVAPFKAQNMSNNSGVTASGGELGRAQILQALAARIEPEVDMNPVLLKPSSDRTSQVVLLGQPWGVREARTYFRDTAALRGAAMQALARLRSRHAVVVLEGAGSCAEVNLRERDFVNFHAAHAAEARVVLVADIDRGGVFAQIVGTLAVLDDADRERIAGFIVNRFRGDLSLFAEGRAYLERRTGLPVFGVLPQSHELHLDAEDGLPLAAVVDPVAAEAPREAEQVRIAVLRLPHISNFTDFDSLARHPQVTLHYLSRPRALSGYDLVLLPGSKAVRADLEWLQAAGWAKLLAEYDAAGGHTIGVCGGYQLIGTRIDDPLGVEGPAGSSAGLGLLPVVTTFGATKVLRRARGVCLLNGEAVSGYEIHMGRTQRAAGEPAMRLSHAVRSQGGEPRAEQAPAQEHWVEEEDGAVRADGRCWGTYLHGLFDSPGFVQALLRRLRPDLALRDGSACDAATHREEQLELLAAHFCRHVDVEELLGGIV